MTTKQILQSLTKAQKEELDKDLQKLINKLSEDDSITHGKFGEVNANLRLDNDKLLLNMTFAAIQGPDGKLIGQIINLIKFNTVDEYLDSINKSNSLSERWKKIKL